MPLIHATSAAPSGLAPSASPDVAPRILSVAERLVLGAGYTRFTMDQLADELGMSKKTLYKHFASKEELVATVLDARAARLERELTALLARPAKDFRRKMVTFVTYVVARFAEVSEPFLQDVRRSAPELFQKIEQFREQAIPRHVGTLLEEGIASGIFRKDCPPPIVAAVLVHAAQNMILPRSGGARFVMPPGELMEILVRIVCEGIIVRSSPRGQTEPPPRMAPASRRRRT